MWLSGSSGFESFPRLQLSPGQLWRIHFLDHSLKVVARTHFLPPCLMSSSFFSTLPHTPLQRASYNMAAFFIRGSKWRAGEDVSQRESTNETEVTVFCNFSTEVTTHHFYHILFIRNQSLDPAHIQGHGCQENGIIGIQVRSCLPQSVIKIPPELIPAKPLELNLEF